MQTDDYDIVIVGGGLVGASLAVALKPLAIKIALIDSFHFGQPQQPSYDDRSIALSYGSRLIYMGMKLWTSLAKDVSAIDKIHVSDRGFMGAVRLDAVEEKVAALGYLIESRVLGGHLYAELNASAVATINRYMPADVVGLDSETDRVEIEIKSVHHKKTQVLRSQLLVIADGTNSTTRQKIGITSQQKDYGQIAIIANITPDRSHKQQAFERFTENGPIALLPLSDNRCSLIWTHKTEQAAATLALDDNAFLQHFQQAFGYRLGRFIKVGQRSSFPLTLTQTEQLTATRTVLIGNAAQTLHPVAGQGLNLGLRDIAQLVELIADQRYALGSAEMLQYYVEQRQPDRKAVIQYTDSLIKLFSNDSLLLGHVRGVGLMATDRLPLLKKWLVRKNIGYHHRKTRLARGLMVKS
ncbi:MAG TPA: 2-octaprenyl-6-methoxyphenyl hydroxylase [Thiothrix sp.]|nr:2-octaprenyl-6-methoxyphenyl hydroxylase [Thiothrix sp.]